MEDGHTTGSGLYESNQLSQADTDRIISMLETIVGEGRIAATFDGFEKMLN